MTDYELAKALFPKPSEIVDAATAGTPKTSQVRGWATSDSSDGTVTVVLDTDAAGDDAEMEVPTQGGITDGAEVLVTLLDGVPVDVTQVGSIDAAGAATQYFWHDADGAHVSTVENDATTGANTLIDSSGMQVRNGANVAANFGGTSDGTVSEAWMYIGGNDQDTSLWGYRSSSYNAAYLKAHTDDNLSSADLADTAQVIVMVRENGLDENYYESLITLSAQQVYATDPYDTSSTLQLGKPTTYIHNTSIASLTANTAASGTAVTVPAGVYLVVVSATIAGPSTAHSTVCGIHVNGSTWNSSYRNFPNIQGSIRMECTQIITLNASSTLCGYIESSASTSSTSYVMLNYVRLV